MEKKVRVSGMDFGWCSDGVLYRFGCFAFLIYLIVTPFFGWTVLFVLFHTAVLFDLVCLFLVL